MANEFIARNGITSLGNIVVSGSLTATGAITVSGSIASASFATNAATASSADNLLVRSTLTAQTLVVQTITSSVDFVTGSTRFGSLSSNTHVFTGSMAITGGFALNNGAATFGSTISLADDLTFTSTNPQIKWTSGSLRFTQLSSALTYLTISSTGAATFSGSVDIQNANKLSIYRADNARALQLYTTLPLNEAAPVLAIVRAVLKVAAVPAVPEGAIRNVKAPADDSNLVAAAVVI